MMVSPAPTRSLHRASRCRFISSMLRNGRFQTSRIDRSAKWGRTNSRFGLSQESGSSRPASLGPVAPRRRVAMVTAPGASSSRRPASLGPPNPR